MIEVAVTHYVDGEHTTWAWFPEMPRIGETVFLSDDLPAMRVRAVYWSKRPTYEGWHPEIHLGI